MADENIAREGPRAASAASGDGHRQAQADLEREARSAQPGFLLELWRFLCHNKKWWLAPIILVLLLLGVLLVLGGTGAAPFIYTLF
ncbi:MAG: DUF5989 family protein [Planctomycetota bacterium]|jgi:hypothetical protein